MKVIKKGSGAKGWSKTYTCTGDGNDDGGCGAKLLVEHADVFTTHKYDYGGGHDVFFTFRCVECGVLTDIEDGPSDCDIPDYQTWKKRNPKNKKG